MNLRILAFSRASRFLFVPLFAAWLCFPAQAKRKDIVVMNNGDHFTGEVKRLENGLLYVERDYVAGNIVLDWNQMHSVQSIAAYRIVLNNGTRPEGKIEKVPGEKAKDHDVLNHEATEEVQIASDTVVGIIVPLSMTFGEDLKRSVVNPAIVNITIMIAVPMLTWSVS